MQYYKFDVEAARALGDSFHGLIAWDKQRVYPRSSNMVLRVPGPSIRVEVSGRELDILLLLSLGVIMVPILLGLYRH